MSHYSYSREYVPTAPVVEIRLGAPGTEAKSGLLKAFVDTGADVTLIPMKHLRRNGAKKVDQATLRSQWGERRMVALYAVATEINQHHFNAIRAVGDEIGDEVILGRNLLNRLRLLLDGPASVVEVLDV
ncbi:MAG: retroviral-like aspartic protease family protein [Chloroflexota bacterium]|nr:retroviral-like aspartic protease family protein [Chloroflexota bacterium]